MTHTFHILRILSGALVLAVVAGCNGDADSGYKRPANVPAEARMILPTAPHDSSGLDDIAGSEHGVAFTTRGNELHVLRPGGREIVTKDVPLSTCPATGGLSLSKQLYVLSDRVVMYDDGCGLWSFPDGDASPRVIASIQKLPYRVGSKEEGRGVDLEIEEWTWEGGATGMRTWLGPHFAFRGDSLFMCTVPVPKSLGDFPNAEVWRTDIDGHGVPERIATLQTFSCDVLLVDDDALYVEEALPRTEEELQMRGDFIDRIDRKTGAVTRLAHFSRDDSYVKDVVLTAAHVVLLEGGSRGGKAFARVHRFPKSGGPVEAVAGEHRFVDGLRSAGESAFFVVHSGSGDQDSILRVDGTTTTTMVKSEVLSHYAFAAGGGHLVWSEVGVTGDDSDDAIFAMPSSTTPAPR